MHSLCNFADPVVLMGIHIPQRIFDYPVSATSPVEDLVTLSRLLEEVGGFASTVMNDDCEQLAVKCRSKAEEVEEELLRRDSSDPELQHREAVRPFGLLNDLGLWTASELSEMTISELEQLYRNRPLRIKARRAEGMEHFTHYPESHIVAELKTRQPANQSEQLKIDYCLITHSMEMTNMSLVLALPLGTPVAIDSSYTHIPSALKAIINRYTHYKTVNEREALIEATDIATHLLPIRLSMGSILEYN